MLHRRLALSGGNAHNHTPLPLVLAGGASGRLEGGRHVAAPLVTYANLQLALPDKLGVEADQFVDSTGMLEI
jgi:hypothetical protein